MPRPDPQRGSATITAAAGAAVLLLLVLILAAAGGSLLGSSPASACQLQPAPSTAGRGIPAGYLADYIKAGRAYGIPWTILAGIGEVESGHGRSALPGVHSGTNAYGAAGPMQFGVGGVIGDTWGGAPVHPASQHTGGYGIDGDGDGIVDVYDPGDAIPSAAAFLVAHGAPGNIPAALTAWDHLPGYVTQVMSWAAKYAATGATGAGGSRGPGLPAAQRGPAARRDRREDPRLRRAAARQALPVGGDRAGRVRLLRAGHDGLPSGRDHHPPHQPGPVGLRQADPRQPGPARRPGVLRRVGRHHDRPRPRRHRAHARHHDRRPVYRAGSPGRTDIRYARSRGIHSTASITF